jgi:outer membrane protein, heavy metal efflux system
MQGCLGYTDGQQSERVGRSNADRSARQTRRFASMPWMWRGLDGVRNGESETNGRQPQMHLLWRGRPCLLFKEGQQHCGHQRDGSELQGRAGQVIVNCPQIQFKRSRAVADQRALFFFEVCLSASPPTLCLAPQFSVIRTRGNVIFGVLISTDAIVRFMKKSNLIRTGWVFAVGAIGLLLAGCHGVPIKGEKEARQQVQSAADTYRPNGKKPTLPVLTTNSSLADYLTYALVNQPKVEATYFDWVASVERITVQRSLPDPQLTFQMDIQDVVTSLMPGLMMNFPGMGKLRAAGERAAAASQSGYFTFKSASLETAYDVKRTYYRLYFLEEKIRVNQENLVLVKELEQLARTQNEVGKANLQDVLRAQIEQSRLNNEILNLADSREPLLAQFKAALGLGPDDPAPPVPAKFESTPLDVPADMVLKKALAENLRLKALSADVHAAEAAIRLAYKARMPDTSIGVMADAKMNPTLYRPWGTVSIPLWRDKLAAQVAEAQANKRAGEARLSAEQISLAVDIAERSFVYRETTRNLELLQNELLPKQRKSLELARSSYLSGQVDFLNLTDTEQTLLRFDLDQVEARTQRELSLAELSLIMQGMPPSSDAAVSTGMSSPTGGGSRGSGAMGAGPSSSGMGSAPAMLPGNSAPPKMNSGGNGGMK